jgi:ribosomal protein S27AE
MSKPQEKDESKDPMLLEAEVLIKRMESFWLKFCKKYDFCPNCTTPEMIQRAAHMIPEVEIAEIKVGYKPKFTYRLICGKCRHKTETFKKDEFFSRLKTINKRHMALIDRIKTANKEEDKAAFM